MPTDKSVAPIIIKRKKIIMAGGHHGGAWKVAYADFVTAMMAFFMLMWLLNATTEQQRKGIADYFSPTLAINRSSGGGDGSFVGDSVFSEQTLTHQGIGASTIHPTEATGSRGASGLDSQGAENTADTAAFQDVIDRLQSRSGESAVSDDLLKHIVTRVTDEGLVVELFDTPDLPLFYPDNSGTQGLADIMSIVATSALIVKNPVAIETHVASKPSVFLKQTQWTDTTARAESVRTALVSVGFDTDRVARITGHADRENRVANPMAPRNNRIEIIFLRQN